MSSPPYPDILDAAAFSGIAPVHVVHPLKIADINTNDDDQFAGIQIAGMMSLCNIMEGYFGKYILCVVHYNDNNIKTCSHIKWGKQGAQCNDNNALLETLLKPDNDDDSLR